MNLDELSRLAERQLTDLDLERDMFPTRNYIAALRGEVEKLTLEKDILKRRLMALNELLLSGGSGAVRPFSSKLVETRTHGVGECGGASCGDFAFESVEDLDNPGVLRGSERTEVHRNVQSPLDREGVKLEEIVGGNCVDELSHE